LQTQNIIIDKTGVIMLLQLTYQLKLPLENPVLLFALILFIILYAPILLKRLNIPPLIGLIVAGAVIGPHGFNLMLRDSSIILFGTVGLLYIMFLSGLDTSIREFKEHLKKSIVFSFLTFSIPMLLGTLSSVYILGFPIMTSLLLASMYASNTLITYPMVSKLGITKNKVVNIAVSGTLVTTILALLVLAVIVGMTQGEITKTFWIKISVSLIVFVTIIMVFFPMLTRWFFKRYDDNISQYIFVLGMIYLGAFLAETAGIDKIIGAFLAGLSMNSLISKTSPLMNRIHFVGNALFIPFFLIGVGMLIDYKAFIGDKETIMVAITMTVVATVSKYSAAWITQKAFRLSRNERILLFGLTNSQAASTLAAVLVGYNIVIGASITGEPIRLLKESILNGTILMILITCTIASFATQRGGQKIANMETDISGDDNINFEERILVPVNNPESIDELVSLGISLKSKRNKDNLYALSIITSKDTSLNDEKFAKDNLQKASIVASSTDNIAKELLRYDQNVVSGITHVVKEHKISDIIMGLHKKKGITDTFLGNLSEGILAKCNVTTFIYKPVQPFSTLNRHIVVVPRFAEKVIGFHIWLNRILTLAVNSSTSIVFYATLASIESIMNLEHKFKVKIDYVEFSDWTKFEDIALDIKADDNLVVVLSRKSHISYNPMMNRMPHMLNRYFNDNSFLLIYPVQRGVEGSIGLSSYITSTNNQYGSKIERFDNLSESIERIFSKKH
jgi:Kef-type K+ transport system membrane component KefB/nucleotide-binding universal stress UspA family protein